MNYKLLTMLVCAFLFSLDAFAQVTVQGTVTDANTGELLPGVNVVIQELQTGSSTNIDGEYEIPNVPEGAYTLTVTYVGYQRYTNEIDVGNSAVTQNIELQQDIFGLEEIVVTGVGSGTQTTKLGFSVSKVGEAELAEVPATDPGNALRAKIPGITVVQASGDPASSPDIRLRGSTSITGDQAPLIIVDGVITSGSLRDINMEDVESIEVVKGAAASSIYGSLAGNGVIQIITKRNAGKVDEPEIT
ncbi:MAG: TonB-dependent receptor plug domain-containing protein, partial [Bacteroidetes bacterium]|nr:TonB-dependent receptor plug domain-containing protein [Bacteroidota bacterium]